MSAKIEAETPTPPASTPTDTPEFKAAVAEAVKQNMAELRAGLLSDLKIAAASAPGPQTPDDVANLDTVLNKLALAIGVVSDQGTNRKRVAPEELDARQKATTDMGVLLEKAMSLKGDKAPRYKLVGKFYAGNRVIEPFQRLPNKSIVNTEIFYHGIPNEVMRPMNDVAQAIFDLYIRSLGGSKGVNGATAPPPMWMTDRGAVIANHGNAPKSVIARGDVIAPEPVYVDERGYFPDPGDGIGDGSPAVEIISPSDPRATKVPVLGTIAAPATVGQPNVKVA